MGYFSTARLPFGSCCDNAQSEHTTRHAIEEPFNEIEVSPATSWEIAIKIRMGKYVLPEPYQAFMEREIAENDFRILPHRAETSGTAATMPLHQRDPFDRLLVAQASVEGIPLVWRRYAA